jgi:cation diffusion facilitator CzcD-associated flavoprotein CzcO
MTAEQEATHTFDVAIIGSGFSGMGMAIKLKQEGKRDFVVLERASDVGGTWHYNTYPGCACDVPSHLYSFSFAPNPRWTETYSKQPEIRSYLERVAEDFGLRPHIRFNHTVESAGWNEDEKRWEVQTDQGPIHARVLVAGMGPLAEPVIPELPGLEDFEGPVFHSARWDHDWDPKGKRVASIGTGASAIQYVPELQKDVQQLHVFQRTPPWVFPHNNRRIREWERRLYSRSKSAQRLMRGGIYAGRETWVVGFAKNPRFMRIAEGLAKRHMRKQISDPELLEQVTPDYKAGCKRILPSNKWYPALGASNVELVTSGVKEIRRNSVVDEGGVEREVDVIVFGTGFKVTDMPVGHQVRGRHGLTLVEHWDGSPRAHLGLTVSGFPNFFLMLGPNTGLGHSSMVYMIESQIAHVMEALRALDANGAKTVEVRQEVLDRYNAKVDEQLEGTVWNTGCKSWYLDDTGRNSTLWPDWTWRFRQRASSFDPAHYRLEAA